MTIRPGDVVFVERGITLPLDAHTFYAEKLSSALLLKFNAFLKIYKHYGVCISKDRIIHFHTESYFPGDAEISKISFAKFSAGREIYKEHITDAFDVKEIIKRAKSKLGTKFDGYYLLTNNCEHFANWCASGNCTSNQVFFFNDDCDFVEKAINNTFNPLIRLGEKIDDFFGW